VKPNEPFLDLPESEDISTEQLDMQVQKAQDRLLSLKREQDVIEKQKRELEEMSVRQDQLHRGRTEMVEKFTRASVVLERETFEAQKRVELLRDIYDSFSQHLHVLESINPKAWEGADINRELSKALSAVDDARAEYGKSVPKIQSDVPIEQMESGEGLYESAEHTFVYWLKAGFAFTLPILLLGIIALALWFLR